MMTNVETQYFSLSKQLLLFIGLWPFQQSKAARLKSLFYLCILAAAIIFQLTTFFTSKCTTNFIIKVLGTVLGFIMFLTKYVLFHAHIETVKDLLTQLLQIYNGLKERNEIAIIEKYGCNAKRYTAILATFGISCISIIIVAQFWSNILDFIIPKNESRPHRMQITMEYFLDQEKYFYLIMIHLNASILIGTIAILAIGVTFISYFQYICGMFSIASYRIEYAMKIDILQDNWRNENFILKRIIHAVDIHRQALKLCDFFLYKFEILFSCLIVLGVACLSLNLFRIFQTISSTNNKENAMPPVLFAAMCVLYMFVANYVGQDITDHNNRVYIAVYNVHWYSAPIDIQKLILFLLQTGIKNFTLNFGGLFDASLEGFATLVKASGSYFTVIYSTR